MTVRQGQHAWITIDFAAADIFIRRGVVRGYSGFTWWREGTRFVAYESTGTRIARLCALCESPAVLERQESDNRSLDLCEEHGYADTWMTRAEFRRRIAEMKEAGVSGNVILAFWLWGLKRLRG